MLYSYKCSLQGYSNSPVHPSLEGTCNMFKIKKRIARLTFLLSLLSLTQDCIKDI